MSRRVRLDGTPEPESRVSRRRRLLGRHLWARLHEYEGIGLTLSGPCFEEQSGFVLVDFPGRDNGEMVRLLSQDYGVCTCLLPQGKVSFCVGEDTTFEDIDYVQGAIGALLS